MKKFFIPFILALLMLVTALPLSAHDAVTNAEWGTPVIDGTKEAIWDSAQSISVAEVSEGDLGDQTATAVVYSLWDGNFIYFYAVIADKTVDAQLKDDAWNQDAMGFMLDFAYKREPEVSYRDLGADAYAGYVNVPAVEGTKNYPEGPTIFGIQKYIDGTKSYCKLTATGYEIEIQIPLAYKTYNAGDKIGYEIFINNAVGDGTRAGVVNWKAGAANGVNSWQYANDMGTLIFNAKPAETAAPDTAAPETAAPAAGDTAAPVTTTAAQTADTAVAAAAAFAIICLGVIITAKKKSR